MRNVWVFLLGYFLGFRLDHDGIVSSLAYSNCGGLLPRLRSFGSSSLLRQTYTKRTYFEYRAAHY